MLEYNMEHECIYVNLYTFLLFYLYSTQTNLLKYNTYLSYILKIKYSINKQNKKNIALKYNYIVKYKNQE